MLIEFPYSEKSAHENKITFNPVYAPSKVRRSLCKFFDHLNNLVRGNKDTL